MSGRAFVGGAVRSLSSGKVRVGGATRRLTRGVAYISGAVRTIVTFVPPLSASASPSDATGTTSGHFGATATSNYVTITPVGGLAPFTYSWAVGSGITAAYPASATTYFSAYLSPFQETVADATCTVTDSLGTTATATVSVDLVHEGS